MPERPSLKAVPSSPEREAQALREPSRPERYRRASLLLGIALLVTLALLVWSRIELGDRIAALEDETRVLESAIAERELVIRVQERRIDDVRDKVDELRVLLDEPLPRAR